MCRVLPAFHAPAPQPPLQVTPTALAAQRHTPRRNGRAGGNRGVVPRGSHRRLQPFLQVVGTCCYPQRMRRPGPFAGKAFTVSGSGTPESALAPDYRPGSRALAPAASHIVPAPTLCTSGQFRKMRWAESILGRMRYRGIRPSAFTGRPTIRAVWNSGWASLPLITQTPPSLACLSPSPAGARRYTVHSPGEAS